MVFDIAGNYRGDPWVWGRSDLDVTLVIALAN
jgi:hypothetical protein